eukprot:1146305-Pelagomonas_calceolata.AAC.14
MSTAQHTHSKSNARVLASILTLILEWYKHILRDTPHPPDATSLTHRHTDNAQSDKQIGIGRRVCDACTHDIYIPFVPKIGAGERERAKGKEEKQGKESIAKQSKDAQE